MPTRKRRRSEETSLSKAIQQILTAKGCRCIRIQSGILPVLKGGKTHFVHCAPAGTPDLLVIPLWAKANGVRCVEGRGIQQTVDAVFGKAAR